MHRRTPVAFRHHDGEEAMTTLKDEDIQTRGRAALHTRGEVPGDQDQDDQDTDTDDSDADTSDADTDTTDPS
jgi:hypothetical protein